MIRPKQLIVTILGVSACAGLFVHLAKLHAHTNAGWHHPLASYSAPTSFPGYATPESAIQSLGWAAAKGDFNQLREGVTDDVQQMLRSIHGQNASSHAFGVATQLAGAKILSEETIRDGEVVIDLQPQAADHPWKVHMQKMGNDWKLAGINH
jgi:hypothetical protein